MSDTKAGSWTATDARARFSELLRKAEADGPQTITCNGKPVAVVVAAPQSKRPVERRGTLCEFFQNSPLRGSGIDLERLDHPPRKTEF